MRKLIPLVVLGVLAGTGVASAATTADGVIYACAAKSTGTVRIVARTTKCTSKERRLSWNERGPAGPQGERGSDGPKGEKGADGTSAPQPQKTAREVVEKTLNLRVTKINEKLRCPSGMVATGGGYALDGVAPDLQLFYTNAPVVENGVATGWNVGIYNRQTTGITPPTGKMYVICESA